MSTPARVRSTGSFSSLLLHNAGARCWGLIYSSFHSALVQGITTDELQQTRWNRSYRLKIWGSLLVFALLLMSCGPKKKITYVWVDITARPALGTVVKLEVTVRHSGESISKSFGDGVVPIGFPTSLTITPHDHLGTLRIEAVAYCQGNTACGRGQTSVTVEKKTQPRVTLILEPDDFQVNSTIADLQLITDGGGRSGRQLASSNDGSFVAVFENITEIGRFDGMGRLFTGDGVPKENAVSRTTGDFVLNQSGIESVYYIAVTAAPDGSFLATWADFSAGNSTWNARAFDPTGKPWDEVIVSAPTSPPIGVGHAAAFRSGGYVVVWHQARSTTDQRGEIRIRLLDQKGTPRPNAVTGTSLDFEVAQPSLASMEKPAVAVGPDQAFLVVWLEVSDSEPALIKARRFAPQGEPRSDVLSIATVRMFIPDAPNVAAAPDGYLVVWTDIGDTTGDPDIFLRHVSLDGTLSQPAYRVNAHAEGLQTEPAIAVDAEGKTLVVWSENTTTAEDPVPPGIRGRALHPFGLPVGNDFAINTTVLKEQFSPSVAPAAHGAFVVIWQDLSETPPDVDSGGIRGRLIYPDFAPRDGGLGAICSSENECSSDLTCVSRESVSYCHVRCQTEEIGQPCAFGGVCTPVDASHSACLFR